MKKWCLTALMTIIGVSWLGLAQAEDKTVINIPETPEVNSQCPDISKLRKKGLFWSAPSGWRSYSESFVKEIDSFVGAQWIGVQVGRLICIYKGKEEFTFPVALERNDVIIPEPQQPKWGPDKGGYKNCASTDQRNCKFYIEPPKAAPTNIYEEIRGFKGDKS